MASRKHDRLILSCVLLLALSLSIYFSWLVYGYSVHSLERHGNWESVKRAGGYRITYLGLMGVSEFMRERQALAGSRLNLGSWRGFHEVVWIRPIWEPKEIRFSFSLQKKAYLYFIFNRDQGGGHAFRLSANEVFPSAFLELDLSGKFLKKEPLQTGLQPHRWYSARVIFGEESVTTYLDNQLLAQRSLRVKSAQTIGFRSGQENVAIDDFSLVEAGNQTSLTRSTDDFSPRLVSTSKLMLALAVLAVIVSLGLVSQLSTGGGIISHCLMVSLILSFTLGTFYLADTYLVSHQYLYNSQAIFHPQRGQTVKRLHWIEAGRKKLFAFLAEKVFGESVNFSVFTQDLDPFLVNSLLKTVPRRYLPCKDIQVFEPDGSLKMRELSDFPAASSYTLAPKHQRIAFLGTSQTWGSGAWNQSSTFVGLLHQYVNANNRSEKTETFNLSICGSNSSELLEHYTKWWQNIRPNWLIVNLTSNDPSGEFLYANLQKLLETNRRNGIKTIFMLEANSLEVNSYITRKHAAMKRLALENHVPVFDLHNFINSSAVYDSGFLWWDLVHMDQHGHNIVATWLIENLQAERIIF